MGRPENIWPWLRTDRKKSEDSRNSVFGRRRGRVASLNILVEERNIISRDAIRRLSLKVKRCLPSVRIIIVPKR